MNPNHLRRNEMLLNKLASEYVLGTLRGGARRRFEHWMVQDAVIRQAVAQWQARLNPLAEFAPAAQPSPKVWAGIEKQLGLAPVAKRGWLQTFSEDIRFWRGLSVASSAMAAILLAVLLVREPASTVSYPSHVATLTDERNQAVLLAAENPASRNVTVHVLAPPNIAPDRELELWAITAEGKPRSLGLVPQQGKMTLQLPPDLAPGDAPVLAVSLEPQGGAPAGSGPTGPVLFKGQWMRIQG